MCNAYFNFSTFYMYAASIKDYSKFVEVGVYSGASCAFLAQQLVYRGTRFELYAVDHWTELKPDSTETLWQDFVDRIEQAKLGPYIAAFKGKSVEIATQFDDASMDFVFIDANHPYEDVKADIEAWLPKVRIGGMLAGHDVLEPTCGVKQAVDEKFGTNYSILAGCWYAFIK